MVRKDYLKSIYQLIGFPKIHWDALCKPILNSFDEHELQQVKHVMLIRQSVLLPIGSIAEEIYRKRDIWTYALFLSACQKIKGAQMKVPSVGEEWLASDSACTYALELSNVKPSTGILAEILEKVFIEDNNTESKSDNEKLSDKFFKWLNNEIQNSSLKINEPKGMLHIVEEGVLLTVPKVFKAFDTDNWEVVMQDFINQDYVVFANGNAEVVYNVVEYPGVFVRGLIVLESEFSCESELSKHEINDSLELSS